MVSVTRYREISGVQSSRRRSRPIGGGVFVLRPYRTG
jgi:hypothetical protein